MRIFNKINDAYFRRCHSSQANALSVTARKELVQYSHYKTRTEKGGQDAIVFAVSATIMSHDEVAGDCFPRRRRGGERADVADGSRCPRRSTTSA